MPLSLHMSNDVMLKYTVRVFEYEQNYQTIQ